MAPSLGRYATQWITSGAGAATPGAACHALASPTTHTRSSQRAARLAGSCGGAGRRGRIGRSRCGGALASHASCASIIASNGASSARNRGGSPSSAPSTCISASIVEQYASSGSRRMRYSDTSGATNA